MTCDVHDVDRRLDCDHGDLVNQPQSMDFCAFSWRVGVGSYHDAGVGSTVTIVVWRSLQDS